MEEKLDKLANEEGEDVEAHKLEPEEKLDRRETEEPEDDVEAHGPPLGQPPLGQPPLP